MTEKHLAQLKEEEGITALCIEQNFAEGIIIPVGCPHQASAPSGCLASLPCAAQGRGLVTHGNMRLACSILLQSGIPGRGHATSYEVKQAPTPYNARWPCCCIFTFDGHHSRLKHSGPCMAGGL